MTYRNNFVILGFLVFYFLLPFLRKNLGSCLVEKCFICGDVVIRMVVVRGSDCVCPNGWGICRDGTTKYLMFTFKILIVLSRFFFLHSRFFIYFQDFSLNSRFWRNRYILTEKTFPDGNSFWLGSLWTTTMSLSIK